LSSTPGLIHHGKNSGYQAINVAYLLGCTRIILLGYDMKGGPEAHFFGLHPEGLRRCPDYGKFVAAFRSIDPDEYGIEIINCTPGSALDAFPKRPLDEVLNGDVFRSRGVARP